MKYISIVGIFVVALLCSACNPGEPSTAADAPPVTEVDSTDVRPTNPPDAPFDVAPADSTPADPEIDQDTSAPPPILPPMETYRGTYVDMQEGDYLHFIMKDEAGKRLTFWVSSDMPQAHFLPFLDGLQKPGTKVEVKAKRVTRHVPQAGGEQTFDEAYEIFVLE